MYTFSCEFFCKFEKILIKKFGKYFHAYNIILLKVFDIIELIDTTSASKHNNTKKIVKLTTTNGENFSRKLSQIPKRLNITLVQTYNSFTRSLLGSLPKDFFSEDFSEDLNFKRKI